MAKHWSLNSLVLFLLLLLHLSFATHSAPNITTDQLALLSLKTRITSDPYALLQDWTLSSPVCNWTGVTCGPHHRRVTALNISSMNLVGEIPPQLGNLSFLVSLDMRRNYFTGFIPQELSHLRRLRFLRMSDNNFTSFDSFLNSFSNQSTVLEMLFLACNSLQGSIPESIGNLRNLRSLGLEDNQLSGVIPASLANISSLEALNLSGNSIEGPIPKNIGDLHKLTSLSFGMNQLTGSIPSSLASCHQLQMLELLHNNFYGVVPPEFGNLKMLQKLVLRRNKLSGFIPATVGNLSGLEILDLSENSFEGSIPEVIGNLGKLRKLVLGENKLTGLIPYNIFNISTLETLALGLCNLSGMLPSNFCNSLPNLQHLFLPSNKLDGFLPSSITNCSRLKFLELSNNNFMGSIPNSLGDLRFLEWLQMWGNNLTSESASNELNFITSLTNCRYLTHIDVGQNPLNDILPSCVGNFSSSLKSLNIDHSRINGYIPNEIGNLSGLISLSLGGNNLDGVIPATLNGLHNLQMFELTSNKLRGSIPKSVCSLKKLGYLHLGENKLAGPIPECFGNMSALRKMYLYSNNLSSSIPDNIWGLQDLLELDIASNSISGSLSPQIGNLKSAIHMNLSDNHISGDLPNTFQGLQSMIRFLLAQNEFQGQIPNSIGGMLDLVIVDLSDNNLSGMIPKSLEALQHLKYFNVSFNQLSGEIPSGGPFANFTSRFFRSNSALCGLQRYRVPLCKESTSRLKLKKFAVTIILPTIALVLACILSVIITRRRTKSERQVISNVSLITGVARISYFEVEQSTDGFSDNNLLGRGSFGSVYRGIFRDGLIFAIKVFNLHSEVGSRTFDAECEVLGNLRHRNLVKVISSCSYMDFKALVLEYMPNGSLADWFNFEENMLSIMQRLGIMIDVASALEYLHHGYSTPVVHCDLKPSNILLDENMTAHVSDFGISKMLGNGNNITHTRTLGTMGYMAPEYGTDGIVSTRCDVYSYGILLLETLTGKSPSDEMFGGNLTLKMWVKDSLPNGLSKVVDAHLISAIKEEHLKETMHGLSSIFELALSCLNDSPSERMNMQQVLAELKKIKDQL